MVLVYIVDIIHYSFIKRQFWAGYMARISNKKIKEALKKTGGFVSPAARSLNITSRTLYRKINQNEDIKIFRQEIIDSRLDIAELELIKALQMHEPWAVKFYLEKKGWMRGYGPPPQVPIGFGGSDPQSSAYESGVELMLAGTKQGLKIHRIPIFPGQKIPEIEQKPGEVVIMIPAALVGMWSPKRYFIASSGRGAAKSHTFARGFIERCLEKRTKLGCFRKVEKSIGDSVKTLLFNTINNLGVSQYFKPGEEKIKCTLTGSEIVFFGLYSLKNAESVKSAEDLEIAWVEEAQQLASEVWDILTPTIRKDNSEIWCSINPRYKDDIVFKTFLAKDAKIHPRAIITRLSWRDNPWFNDIMREEMEQAFRISHAQASHIWEGELMSQVGQMIKRTWWRRWDQNKLLKPDYVLKFISADTAYSEEETANYSVLQVWAITKDLKHLDLIDSRRGRWAYPKLLAHTKALIQEHGQGDRLGDIPLGPIVIEKKASGQSLIQSLEVELPDKQIMGFDPKTADKVVRVYGVQNKIFDGSVRIPNDNYAPWVKPFLDEVSEFSDTMEHEFDDQVDAMTQAITIWLREVRANG